MQQWFVLIYKVPPEPSRYRAAIWRKLKAAGAIYLQNGAAALPADTASERVLRGLTQEIRQMQGTAVLLNSTPVGGDAELVAAYNAARAEEYAEFLGRCRDFHAELAKEREADKLTFAELEENEEDLHKLTLWLDKIHARDRYAVPQRAEAEAALVACHEDLEAFATAVYVVADQGTPGTPA